MGVSKFPWNEFGKIKDYDDLEEYLRGREYEHEDYCHYTTVETVNKILGGREFWISCVDGFNDSCDSAQFEGQEKYFYSLCFSTGIHENLALWYLYSGVRGKGARISLKKGIIQKLVKQSMYSLYELDGSCETGKRKVMDLKQGVSMELSFRDILYYEKNENSHKDNVDLKYNTMTNHILPKEKWEKYKRKFNGFCKESIWYYEKETRLVVELIKEARTRIEQGKRYVVVLHFDENVYKKMQLMFAPEVTQENLEEIIAQNGEIKDFVLGTSNAKQSAYAGKIRMDLCKKCEKDN